ncbi:hypothetical protein M9H77_36433 [Catharanthus roseus]|uniref:Uncharacterized protein n=1 Tax=Catharanthus roseus TaxID=4058 RepID=A0ACB9ZSM1_CATRO|nr:hypothetical protein M9H77_36433 [Catharanthus roseus]
MASTSGVLRQQVQYCRLLDQNSQASPGCFSTEVIASLPRSTTVARHIDEQLHRELSPHMATHDKHLHRSLHGVPPHMELHGNPSHVAVHDASPHMTTNPMHDELHASPPHSSFHGTNSPPHGQVHGSPLAYASNVSQSSDGKDKV